MRNIFVVGCLPFIDGLPPLIETYHHNDVSSEYASSDSEKVSGKPRGVRGPEVDPRAAMAADGEEVRMQGFNT